MSPSPYQSKSKVQIQSILNDAWLGMKFKENQLFNPLYIIPKEFENEPHIYTTYLMTQPDYFSFLCSEILNVKLLPIQSFILKEMFNHKFPMLIMSRGAGKSYLLAVYALIRAITLPGRKIVIAGSTFRQSKIVFEYIEGIYRDAPILRDIISYKSTAGAKHDTDMWRFYCGESVITSIPIGCLTEDSFITTNNGIRTIKNNDYDYVWGNTKYRKVTYFHNNGITPVLHLRSKLGYEYKSTYDHKMRIVRDDKIVWCETKDITTDDFVVIDRSSRWFDPTFKCDVDSAYVLGAMIGDGTWTDKNRLQITGRDFEIVSECEKVFGKSKTYDSLHHYFLSSKLRKDWLDFWNMEVLRCSDKILPNTILSSSKDAVAACLSGLFDTDGGVYVTNCKGGKSCSVRFFNTSYTLVKQIQYILLHFGIISTIQHREQRYSPRTQNPAKPAFELIIFGNNIELFYKHINFRLSRKKNKLEEFIKNKKHNYSINSNIVPINKEKLLTFSKLHKNNYAIKYLTQCKNITQERLIKIIDSFKINDLYLDELKLLTNSNLYFDKVKFVNKTLDLPTYDVHIPEDHEYCANGFFSHNTGDGIRGLRANDIIADEFKCLRSNTLCETDKGLIRIQSLKDELIINRYGQYEKVIDKFISKNTEILEVRTKYGYSIQCSPNHRILTKDGWKQAKEITSNDSLAFTNAYIFPKEKVKINDTILDKDLAWLFGFLIAEGALTSKYSISITNTNKYLIQKCIKIINRFNIKYTITKRKAYLDNRGWKCKKSFVLNICSKNFRDLLYKFGLEYKTCYNKKIPWSILQSPKEIVISFLNGLFTGDGSCFNFYYKNKKRIGCSFYSVSEVLMRDVHTLLFKLNIISHRSTRISKISKKIQHFIRISGIKAVNFIQMLNDDYWNKYLDGIDLINTYHRGKNRYINDSYIDVSDVVKLNLKEDLYDITTESTHSFYADGFIQHNSHDRNIFETVIAGFGAVSANPVDNVKYIAKKKMATELGIVLEDEEKIVRHVPNQIILSGTAYYQFNHFYDYFKKWKSIIKYGHNKEQFERIFGDGSYSSDINSKDYCVIRIPIELIPEGFMDSAQIARSKATMHSGNFGCEYGATFSADSNGFFKRSLIQSCTVTDTNNTFNGKKIIFYPTLVGDKNAKYVIGIDPASEEDNFAITVIELHEDHKRVVYSWTITRKEQKARLADGSISVNDYFGYCAKKIRELMRVFPPVIIGIDSQGGGYAVMEALVRTEGLAYDEKPIYELIEYNDPKDTDPLDGLHLIKKIQFADAKWMSEANNSLRLSLENKRLLFPHYDALTNTMASYSDSSYNRLYDTLEDVVNDIEEMKDELSTIIMTSTESGRDKWTTPDKKDPGMKKGKMRKDRYTALLIANYVADLYLKDFAIEGITSTFGGFAYNSSSKDTSGPIYNGPAWFTKQMEDVYE